MKQTETTILLGLLSLISFLMGHASTHVHEFWSEPNVLWIVFVLPTGNLIQIYFHHTICKFHSVVFNCVFQNLNQY